MAVARRLLAVALLLGLTSGAGADIQVVDDLGLPVRLAAPARRIVTLAPHASELVLALGVPDRLAAVADFSGYPTTLEGLPRLSALGPLDRERLLALRPDLVIAWASGNRPADLRWLTRQGIAVYRSEPRKLTDIATALEKIGKLAGQPQAGHRAARRFLSALRDACANRRRAPWLRAYLEIWPSPPLTIGGRHWLNDALAQAHLRNIFSDLPRGLIRVSRESLLAREPQVVLTHAPSASTSREIALPPQLERPGPRVTEGLAQLCRNIPTRASDPADRQAGENTRH